MEPQEDEETSGNIHVICRFRPLNDKEKEISNTSCVSFPSSTAVIVTAQDQAPLTFKFDRVFSPLSTQQEVYEFSGKPIVESVMQGFNGTIFAYGQTSSGKTFTMSGDQNDPLKLGITPRMVGTVFDIIDNAPENIEFTVKVSFCEIYMEKISDLLDVNKENLKIRENKNKGIYIADLSETYVTGDFDVLELLRIGNINRQVGESNMNAKSSRSHSLFSLTVTQTNTETCSARVGKLYLVDLAGSEKVSKTGAVGKRLEEAKNINKSLTALGQVIACLTDGKSTHVPYRDSKLTRVLQDSLGGNSKTALIITCSPSPYNESETISTLRFGTRAKFIKNQAKINREYTIAELKIRLAECEEELHRRNKRILALEQTLNSKEIPVPSDISMITEKIDESFDDSKNIDYEEVVQELEDVRARLKEEIEINTRLRSESDSIRKKVKDAELSYSTQKNVLEFFQDKTQELEREHAEKEEILEQLAVAKDAMENELETCNSRIYQLDQEIMKRIVEIEHCKCQLNTVKTVDAADSSDSFSEVLKSKLLEEQQKNSKITQEISDLQQRLDQVLVNKLKQTANSSGGSSSNEKQATLEEIKSKVEYIKKIEKDLQAAKINFLNIEKLMTDSQRMLKIKHDGLEKTVDHLSAMYRELTSRQSSITLDKMIVLKKISRLEEKIKSTEEEIQEIEFKKKKLEERPEELMESKQSLNSSVLSMKKSVFRGRNSKVSIEGRSSIRIRRLYASLAQN
jgi:kinesin family member 5